MILNLAYPEESQIKFTVSKFPDGQQTIDLTDTTSLHRYIDAVQIKTRLNSFKDLELLICAVAAIRNINSFPSSREIVLYIPYFLGSRSDRKFQEGGVNYLKQVICPIINSLNFSQVIVLDPHSDVLEACLDNFFGPSNNFDLVRYALEEEKIKGPNAVCLVSPDAGALKKVFNVAKYFNIKSVVTAAKVRDLKTGEILRTEVPSLPTNTAGEELKYVIVDDICDGGRTFIELAKAIKEQRPEAKIYLVVTHGIFSAGFDFLVQYFDGIYTTNSVKDIQDGTIVDTFSRHKTIHSFVKQLNVF